MEVHRIPQGQYVDGLRWLPIPSTLALSLWDADTGLSTLEIAFLQDPEQEGQAPWMETQASWDLSTRTSAMKSSSNQSNIALALASETGSLQVFLIDAMNPSLDSAPLVLERLHKNVPSALDIQKDTLQCVTVGSDGRINLVQGMGQEFNGGTIAGLVELLLSPLQSDGVGSIHTVDVHQSRKHLSVVGGSGGTVLAWDLRRQNELHSLAGRGCKSGSSTGAEGEIWNVKLDPALQVGQGESGKIPPVLMCSEDGILALIESGMTTELAVESCAINSFDVDLELGSEIVCALEHESVLYVKRSS
ncbi:nuclear pore complex protein NUP43 isoform X2 [Physcomitrium patens]|uniref:nuclear pore complex protein NUP43 isoform X2 n=1 Tax=Physcomitrium patens TaxID=3218 RepID=UPI000D154131|nr:nuclear pore complex protein NUP43-like isoform X2 [Physcomitrium patens]|eukprot:XP_024377360.1 nuclear pore complex protein NUP43-like isoform X2 [Physcomitrella patens]